MERSKSGGASLSGVEQVVTGEPIWSLAGEVQIATEAQELNLNAIRSLLRGRANRCRVDLAAVTLVPNPDTLPATTTLTSAAALRATSIEIDTTSLTIADLLGCWINVGDWLHEVAAVDAGTDTLTINPPLRAAADNGATVTLTAPVFIGRAASDDMLALPANLIGHGSVAVQFIEAFDR